MKQRLWLVGIIMLLLAPSIFAAEDSSVEELSFTQAMELMNEHNIDLQIAEINMEIAEIDYKKAMAANLMSGSQQSQMQAEHNLERAKNAYLTSKRNNYLEIFSAYTDVLAAERILQIRELESIIAEHDYEIIQEKVEIGDAGRLDDLQERNRVEAAWRNENIARQGLAENERILKRLVGIGDGTALQLSANFPIPELAMTLEESIELGLENSFNLWDQKTSLELQERQFQTAKIDGAAPIDVRQSELNLAISKLNLAQEEANLVENITASYHSVEDSRSRWESALRDFEIAEETYDIYRQQEEVGLITEIQLLQQQIAMLNTESSLQDAHIAYLINYLQFHHTLGLDGSL